MQNLARFLLDKKYDVLMYRMSIGAPSNQVSLYEKGLSIKTKTCTRKGYLFERFINRNPHLDAFKQYYRWKSDYSVHRNLASVNITEQLTDAMFRCTDLTI